jgi:hypothetical protein
MSARHFMLTNNAPPNTYSPTAVAEPPSPSPKLYLEANQECQKDHNYYVASSHKLDTQRNCARCFVLPNVHSSDDKVHYAREEEASGEDHGFEIWAVLVEVLRNSVSRSSASARFQQGTPHT